MAERRMFSKQIIDSDPFLDMPLSTQALYFHLAMRADDDGFVNNPKKIMRMTGSNSDELQVLLSKRFVLIFDSGVLVIKHWKIHNYIQKDRYKPTVYQEELSKLKLKDNNGYSLDTECLQIGDRMETQVSIGKNSIGKNSKELPPLPPDTEIQEYFFQIISDQVKELNKSIEDVDKEKAFIDFHKCLTFCKDKHKTTRKKSYNWKNQVNSWVDITKYRNYKKLESDPEITCDGWDDMIKTLKQIEPKCLPGKIYNELKHKSDSGYLSKDFTAIWKTAVNMARNYEYQEV